MNKTYGVMFKAEMIRAYLAGVKTQTRRMKGLKEINQSPDDWMFIGFSEYKPVVFLDGKAKSSSSFAVFSSKRKTRFPDFGMRLIRLPFGGMSDSLYFKETWKMFERETDGRDFLHFRADDAKLFPDWWWASDWRAHDPFWFRRGVFKKWQSSMLMPRLCSRFRNIPILNVRVERLHDIEERDAIAEGCEPVNAGRVYPGSSAAFVKSYRLGYLKLWNEINGKTAPAATNPWLFVYEFPAMENK